MQEIHHSTTLAEVPTLLLWLPFSNVGRDQLRYFFVYLFVVYIHSERLFPAYSDERANLPLL